MQDGLFNEVEEEENNWGGQGPLDTAPVPVSGASICVKSEAGKAW